MKKINYHLYRMGNGKSKDRLNEEINRLNKKVHLLKMENKNNLTQAKSRNFIEGELNKILGEIKGCINSYPKYFHNDDTTRHKCKVIIDDINRRMVNYRSHRKKNILFLLDLAIKNLDSALDLNMIGENSPHNCSENFNHAHYGRYYQWVSISFYLIRAIGCHNNLLKSTEEYNKIDREAEITALENSIRNNDSIIDPGLDCIELIASFI